MFDNACLSEPGYYSRSMVVEALDDVCSFGKIGCGLLNIFFLCLEEKMLLVCRVFCYILETACCDFEVSLLSADFKESLTCTVTLL
jgi:hypothetical protein